MLILPGVEPHATPTDPGASQEPSRRRDILIPVELDDWVLAWNERNERTYSQTVRYALKRLRWAEEGEPGDGTN